MNRGIRFFTGTKRKKAGFSLAEVLVVIVILGILAAVGGVSAVSMYKNMKQTQLDKTAETIFHAAQDRLSELYAYGKEDTIDKDHGGTQVDGYADKKVFYIKSGVSSEANTAIMGDDTVNGEIFANYWVIEYQASTCRVLNVVYADRNDSGLGGFGRGINEGITITTLENAITNHAFSLADRKDKFGWYGETDILPLLSENKQVGNTSVDVDIVNEENLYAHVRVSVGWEDSLTATEIPDFLKNVTIKLTLKDADTGAEYGYPSITADKLLSGPGLNNKPEGIYNGKSDADGGVTTYVSDKYISASWDVLLDSLYDGAFVSGSESRYVPSVTPGHDFYLIAKLEGANGITPTVQDYDIDNSLFAAASGTKAYIEYGRHLQNVGKAEVSGLNAIQIADINFNAKAPDGVTRDNDLDKFNKFWLSVYDDVGGFTNFKPTDSSYLASYDGQNHLIKNLDINQVNGTSDSGILGTLSYADTVVSVKNVIITDSTISSTSGAGKAGMFAANVTASNGVSLENCYLNNVTIDGSNTASLGGFIGEVTSDVTAENCSFAAVKVGTNVSPASSGAFIGRISAALNGKNLTVLGGSVSATSNSGGIIGSSDADSKDITLKGCKVFGTEIAASNGNAGGIAGNVKNAQMTISEDTAVASGIVRSSSGNAGGFIGNADSVINIKDSEYFIPSSSESDKDACSVKTEFVKTMGLTADTPNAILKYVHLKDKFEFKYIEDLKADDVVSNRTIVGYGNVGGLVGASTKNITIENTFSAGVLSAATNAGGFVGSTTGKLSVNSSYSDFYISGKNVGGFAAACNSSSEFHSCYTAGFLTSTADTAAGFAPVEIGDVSDSYSVFNFDNVCDFSGKAGQDSDHNVNVNGTVNNYPDVNVHNNCYPIAPKSKGVAYYVYTATTFTESANAVAVTSTELAENTKTGGGTLLGGNFVTGTDSGSTYPYSLSSFLDTTLVDYPFPKLSVSKVTVTDSSPTENVKLGHYNDWLTLDGKNDIEIWYIMYDENLNNLKTDVPGIGRTGMKLARRTKAIPVTLQSGASEYQINVGNHTSFSGYKFVGYYDPDTATKVGTTSFDRSKKLDYLDRNDTALSQSIKTAMKSGDRVVQTSINTTNTFGEACGTHSAILRAGSDGTKRLYAVYRRNLPYTVKLSYLEYKLPKQQDTQVGKTLEEIYTKASKITSDDIFEVTYTSPEELYKFLYVDHADIRAKVEASHAKLVHDEELTEDFIAEDILRKYYPSDSVYKEKLTVLDDIRAGKQVSFNGGSIAAKNINHISRSVLSFTNIGYDLLDFDKLVRKGRITSRYATNARNLPVYTMVRLSPAKNADGSTVKFEDRVRTEVKADNNNKITLDTNKQYEYIILYNSNKSTQTLNIVFRNTEPNESSDIPVIDKRDTLDNELKARSVHEDSSDVYRIKVGDEGFTDYEGNSLAVLMNPATPPTFKGFTLNKQDSIYDNTSTSDSNTVTLYYDRNYYTLSFKLNQPTLNPRERYNKATDRDPITRIYYGQAYQGYLWETNDTSAVVDFTEGPYLNNLKNMTGTIYVYSDYSTYYYDTNHTRTDYTATGYNDLKNYIIRKYKGTNTGSLLLEFKYNRRNGDGWYTWTKSGDDFGYLFNREGYVLSGFTYYLQNSAGEFEQQSDPITLDRTMLMPDCNVMVQPQWTVNPMYLRVELYYQNPNDYIEHEKEDEKEYELFKGTLIKVNNGIANQLVNDDGQLVTLANPIPIAELITKENSTGGLVEYLEPYYKANTFKKRDDHDLSGSGFNPYVANVANTRKLGTHHFAGNDTMVVALYYDRKPIEYRFHYITQSNYTVPYNSNYVISNQWNDIVNNSSLYKYSGDDEYKKVLRDELQNKTGVYKNAGNFKVKVVESNPGVNAARGMYINYGGRNSQGQYRTGSVQNGQTIKYGITVYYQALYGASTVFLSDPQTSFIPSWYCYMDGGAPKELQNYCIGGNTARVFNMDFNTFVYVVECDSIYEGENGYMDFYPYYPDLDGSGYLNFYVEKAPCDGYPVASTREGIASTTNLTNLLDLNVGINGNLIGTYSQFKTYFDTLFNLSSPSKQDYGYDVDGVVILNGLDSQQVYIEGYTGFAYGGYNNGTAPTALYKIRYNSDGKTVTPANFGNGYTYKTMVLKRNTYTLNFVDASLKSTGATSMSYLYKQTIPKLPGADEIEGTMGDSYIFDGWYTSSTPSEDTRITYSDGNITDHYKSLASTLTYTYDDASGHHVDLLMNHENLQVFANWAPKECYISFNPFYPDVEACEVDDRLTIETNPVPYGSKISALPTVMAPKGYGPNYTIEQRGNDIYYVIKDNSGDLVGEYKFLGWYKYKGTDTPSSMDDLTVEFVAGVTEVTNHTTLYAKWEGTMKPTYTIVCRDYEDEKVIFSVLRYAEKNEALTIDPAHLSESTGRDVQVIKGRYDDLLGYESLSSPIDTIIKGEGETFSFRYRRAPEWKYTVKTCLNVGGKDILITKKDETTTYVIKQIESLNIPGYSVYEYQIGEGSAVSVSASDDIQVERPANIEETLEITIRYHFIDGVLKAKADGFNYYKYDPIDWVDCALNLEEGSDWKDVIFTWEDEGYAPAIVYTIGDVTTSAFIGDDTSDAAIVAISAIHGGTYTANMQLVAMKKDGSETIPIVVNAGTDAEANVELTARVTIIDSYYVLTFKGDVATNDGKIYYKHDGVNTGTWYWDETFSYPIGRNGTNIVQDITSLPTGGIRENAQKVIDIIEATDPDVEDIQDVAKYKAFFVLVNEGGTVKAYTVVDRLGYLRNGNKLKGNVDAYKEGGSGENEYTIILYNKDGEEVGSVIVKL